MKGQPDCSIETGKIDEAPMAPSIITFFNDEPCKEIKAFIACCKGTQPKISSFENANDWTSNSLKWYGHRDNTSHRAVASLIFCILRW